LKQIFKILSDEAEPTDFASKCIDEETKFDFRKPWHVNILALRDYFGEKVAMYFEFLSFYTSQLPYIAFIGFVIQLANISDNA